MVSDSGARGAEGGLTRKGVQTRQRIVAAAAGLILQQGVAGTTLDDVRDEAGVSSSQIYHYFADKEALVRAVVDYRAQTLVGETHEPMLAAIEGIDGLVPDVIQGGTGDALGQDEAGRGRHDPLPRLRALAGQSAVGPPGTGVARHEAILPILDCAFQFHP